MSPILLLVTSVIFLLPGITAIIIGYHFQKKQRSVPRVEVGAHVVEYKNWTRPHKVTFDYPLPDGSWYRAQRYASHMNLGGEPGTFSASRLIIKPGHHFPVYVDPLNPHDVSLGIKSTAAPIPIMVMVFGAGMIGLFLFMNF